MGIWVLDYAGLAMLYAALTSMALWLGAWLVGRAPGRHLLPVVFTTLVFVFLTQHPFPDPAGLDCPNPGGEPQFDLFRFWYTFSVLHERDVAPVVWLRNRVVASTVMNFVVCAVIGMALARHPVRVRTALLFGAGLTLLVETTQLTGIWGLYPCAYRQFNVDDLLMNALGLWAGFLTARALSRKRVVATGPD